MLRFFFTRYPTFNTDTLPITVVFFFRLQLHLLARSKALQGLQRFLTMWSDSRETPTQESTTCTVTVLTGTDGGDHVELIPPTQHWLCWVVTMKNSRKAHWRLHLRQVRSVRMGQVQWNQHLQLR